ncbi:MAG: hypothetical protein JSV32_06485 [Dehalococcoidia bacterium]|nr:MAG: hypothetical protein JSV32_06485 [Dehalococcoidia bacterium]
MIKPKSEMNPEITIDLTGPEGNAFVLLAKARSFAKQLGLDGEAITAEMMEGDYEQLLEVFDREFGSFVTLYR